ncbi:MAG TPA: hypothetical protein VGE01_10545 [Fimbriimonas sp.]
MRHLILIAFGIAWAGCGNDLAPPMDAKIKADYEKAEQAQKEFEKLPVEEQIRRIENDPNIPPNFKAMRIAQVKAKAKKGN